MLFLSDVEQPKLPAIRQRGKRDHPIAGVVAPINTSGNESEHKFQLGAVFRLAGSFILKGTEDYTMPRHD